MHSDNRCKQGTGSRIYMRVLRVLTLTFPVEPVTERAG